MPRFTPFLAGSATSSLDEVLKKVERQARVAGVMLIGSSASGVASWSDYDLLVVTVDGPELDVEFTYVDHRPTDVVFVSQALVRRLSNAQPTSKRDVDVLRWVAGGRIVFARSPDLESFRQVAIGTRPTSGIADSELFFRWVEANCNLRKAQRWLAAPDESYRAALELHLLDALAAILRDHLSARGHPWSGERQAIELVERDDPEFHQTLLAAVRSPSLHEKVRSYGILVERAFEPVGPVWGAEETSGGWTLPLTTPRRQSRWEQLLQVDPT